MSLCLRAGARFGTASHLGVRRPLLRSVACRLAHSSVPKAASGSQRTEAAAPAAQSATAPSPEATPRIASLEEARAWLEQNLPKWQPGLKRTGALALKVGMVSIFDEWGYKQNCTVLQLDYNQVVEVKTKEKNGYTALQIGCGEKKVKHVTRPLIGHFEKHGVPFKYKLSEFRVSEEALLPTGTRIHAQHFVPGQFVDIAGISKGKGFQGVMKRHNFKGLRASHGVSKAHRSQGSTGQCQDPGKVFKGKKMAGRMGGERVTRDNLLVVKIDTERDLIYVRGSVPGNKGQYVEITDARKKAPASPPPFPTYFKLEGESVPREIMMPKAEVEPLFGGAL